MPRATAQVLKLQADNTELRRELREARRDINSLGKAITEAGRRADRTDGRLRRTQAAFRGVRGEARRTRMEFNKLSTSVNKSSTAMAALRSGLVGPIGITAALYAVGRATAYGIGKQISYDRQLTLIQKTTKLTTAELDKLDARIRGIAEVRGIDRDVVAGAAVVAGRLGVSDLDNLAEITELAVKLEKSTDASADQAATSLARIHALTGTGLDSLERTADALVHIGNNAPITESAILDLSVPLAAILGRFGALPEEILATAAALGISDGQAQGAATAWTRLFTGIVQITDEAGPRFEAMARVMGRSAKQLGMDIETDLVGTASEFLEVIKQYDAASQIKLFQDIIGITDVRSQSALFKTLPTLAVTRDLAAGGDDALNLEEQIRLLRISGEFDTSVEALKAGFFAIADVADDVLLPALNGFASAVAATKEALTGQIEDLEQQTALDPVDVAISPELSALRQQAIAVARQSQVGINAFDRQSPFAAGTRAGILSRINQQGFDPANPSQLPSERDLREVLRIAELARRIREGEQQLAAGGLNSLLEGTIRADLDADRNELNLLVSNRPRNAIDELIGQAPPARSATTDAGATSGELTYEEIAEQEAREAAEAAEALRRRGYGRFGGGPGGLGVSAGIAVPGLRGGETFAQELARLGAGGRATGRRNALEEQQREEEELRERFAAADLRQLEMEEMHERRLLRMLREGATADDIAYEERRLQLQRDYAHARATLEGQELATRLAALDRQREEMREAEGQGVHGELGDFIAGGIADAIAENTSIRDAWRAMMHELAADLLREEILDPFREAMKGLIVTSLDALLGQSGQRGAGESILGSIIRGFTGGGGASAGSQFAAIGSGYANGGLVQGNGLALVGERGPELLALPAGSRINPLRGGGGAMMGGATINFNIQSEDKVGVRQAIQEEMPKIQQRVESALLAQANTNSRFARAYKG